MPDPKQSEEYHIALTTSAGEISASVTVPTGFVPITHIVPLMRSLGERAQELEITAIHTSQNESISCRQGCAACCRMLVPVSPLEALALRQRIENLPEHKRTALIKRVASIRQKLNEHGLLGRLTQLAETNRQLTDEDMDPINWAYYQLRLPCAFLEDENCTIYEDRPAACRELLVTSPAEECRDMSSPTLRPVPIPLRISTVLSLLWSKLSHGPVRLIPLPVALDWAERHASDCQQSWTGIELLNLALEQAWQFLSQAGSSPHTKGPGTKTFPPSPSSSRSSPAQAP